MRDLRRLSVLACVLVVLLRMSIGWQFLYEGLWKIERQDSSQPWSAEGYLKNAQGPFRSFFRNLTGDPDELNWLDYDKVAQKWKDWHKRFVNHYDLTDRQKQELKNLVFGPDMHYARLHKLPQGVEFGGSLGPVIEFQADRNRLAVDGEKHLLPRERDRLLSMVNVEENPSEENKEKNEIAKAYQEAVRKVYQRASRLSILDRLAASLKGDPERVGTPPPGISEEKAKEYPETRPGQIELYKERLQRHEKRLAQADQDFEWKHLQKQWKEIQDLRAELVGPVKAFEKEMKDEAYEILNQEQLAQGPVPERLTQMDKINLMTMWSLTILGGLLIAGFLTPLSALAAAGMLTMFYLVVPPWTGVPQAPGPEHSFIINKNLIEAIALLAIAAMPTGRWFGIDALFQRLFSRKKAEE